MESAMKSVLTKFLIMAVVLCISGCGAGYQTLTADQKAEVALNTLNMVFDTVEATFILLEAEGAEHMPTARAAFTILQSAIKTYIANLQIYGILETPTYAVEAIDAMNARAIALGVISVDEVVNE